MRVLLCTVLFSLLVLASPQDADKGVDASVPQSGNVGGEEGAASQVAMARDDKAAAMAEAKEKFKVMEQERIAREEAERRAYEQETRQHTVVYGEVITLRHEATGSLLAATNFKYYHPHSSGQHQIVAQGIEDGYTHWRIMPRAGQRWEQVKDVPVKSGETIRLLNVRTKMCLHSHSGPVSPVTGENEVSNFNEETGSLDANDNWIVKMPEAGSEWKMATNISLFHPSSSANLASRPIDSGNAKFNYTMGHQEVSSRRENAGDVKQKLLVWTAWPIAGSPGFDKYLSIFEAPDERDSKFNQANSDPDNGPKEISIYCPQNPVVSVTDLDYNLVSEGKCFSLNLQSPTFESSLILNCDGKAK